MFVEERQADILKQLMTNKRVLVKDLSQRYQVSEDLIRKDLNVLEKQGKCKKIYGGAILIRENIHRESVSLRKDLDIDEKKSFS